MFSFFASAFFSLLLTNAHDFHVSTTYGEFKGDQLQVTAKVFTDDLEAALEQGQDTKIALGTQREAKAAPKLLEQYFRRHFKLRSTKNDWEEFTFIGYEVEYDITYVYLQYNFEKWPLAVTVQNTLLLELFDDQTNLVNLEQGGKLQSAYYNQQKTLQTLNF